MSVSNVMTRSRTAALRLEEATASLRLEEAAAALRLKDVTRALDDEEEQGPGYFDVARLENPRGLYYTEMELEDAEYLRDYGPYDPNTRSAMEQAGFESVLFKVAVELGYDEDYARYFSKRECRLTLLDAFEAVDNRLKVKELDSAMARNAAMAAARDKLRAERSVLHQQELAAIRAARDAQKVQHDQEMAVQRQRIENAGKRLESARTP